MVLSHRILTRSESAFGSIVGRTKLRRVSPLTINTETERVSYFSKSVIASDIRCPTATAWACKVEIKNDGKRV